MTLLRRGRGLLVKCITRLGLIGLGASLCAANLFANPVLDHVAAGNVSIQQTTSTTTVNQTSQQAIINWQQFNIGQHEATHFQQPAGGIALNRINPNQGPSSVYGRLTATGQIILVNSAGIFFGPSAYVNVGGLIASTSDISDQDFLNGYYHFNKLSPNAGSIINQGQIIAAEHGLIALLGNGVQNNGLIEANLGRIILASGESFTLTFSGNELISFSVDGEAIDGITNTGTLRANGGRIMVTAKTTQGVLDNTINMQGFIEARSIQERNGEIIISSDDMGTIALQGEIDATGLMVGELGGKVTITGNNIVMGSTAKIDVSGNAGGGEITLFADNATAAHGQLLAQATGESGDGGFIETSGRYLDVSGITVNTLAAHGEIGTWLLDPTDITISAAANSNATFGGGNYQPTDGSLASTNINTTSLQTQLNSTNVTVTTTPLAGSGGGGVGNITVSDPITWTAATKLTLNALNNIIINAAINGINGSLELSAVDAVQSITTGPSGTINVANFNLLQGQWYQVTGSLPAFAVSNNFQINSGTLPNTTTQFIRATSGDGTPGTPYVLEDIYGLQGIASNATTVTQSFSLANNIDASGTSTWNSGAGFVPIIGYTGNFDGSNHVVTDLYINRPAQSNVGLFGTVAGGTVTNIGVTGSVTGASTTGLLIGFMPTGTVSNVYSSGTVTASAGGLSIGGLIGEADGGTVSNAYSSANVTAGDGVTFVGGLIGFNEANTSNTYSLGTITVGDGVSNIGGHSGIFFGGGNSITDSYSSSPIILGSGNSHVGGFIGQLFSGSVTNNFWDTDTSGQTTGVGTISGGTVTNLTGGCFSGTCTNGGTANLSALSTYSGAGWDITATPSTTATAPSGDWFIFDGKTRPILLVEQRAAINNAHELQMMGSTLDGTYTLEGNIDFTNSMANEAEIWGTDTSTATGAGFAPVGTLANPFTGSFDGQLYTISNFFIDRPSTIDVGLFGRVQGGAISNIGIAGSVTGNGTTGLLVGFMNGASSINNSYSSGTVASPLGGTGTGGLIGEADAGTISTSFSDASVSAGNSAAFVGGLIGFNQAAISNSYSTGTITTGTSANGVGGLVGANINPGSVTTSYSTGFISVGSGSSNVGGFIGNVFNGSITNSFWDTDTSGRASGFGANTGTITNLTGGCFSGTCTNGGTANLSSSTTFTSAPYNWNFTSPWSIIAGQSYPYLNTIYTSTPRAISGTSSLAGGTTINFASNGAIATQVVTGANGSIYSLVSGDTFVNDTTLLLYVPGSSTAGNLIITIPTTSASLSGLSFAANNTVSITQTAGTAAPSNTSIATAIGSLNNTGILLSATGNNLSLTSNKNFTTGASTTLNLNGNITTAGTGSMTFNGPLSLSAASILTSANQAITLNNTINGAFGLTVDAGSGVVTFANTVGGTTPLSSLNVTGSNINLSGDLTMDGNTTTFNSPVTLTGDTNVTDTGDIIYNSTINGAFNLVVNSSAGDVTFAGIIGGIDELKSLDVTGNTINLDGGSIFTSFGTGDQTYTGAVVLGADLLVQNESGTITFDGTVNGAHALSFISTDIGSLIFNGAVGTTTALTDLTGNQVGAGGEITFNAAVGSNSQRLTSISLTSDTINLNGGSLYTSGLQSYTAPNGIVLGASLLIDSSSANGAINFDNTLSGAFALTINSGSGNVVFGDTVSSLASLNLANTGTTTLPNGVSTTGDQQYADVTLVGDTELVSSTGDIIISGDVAGNGFALTIENNDTDSSIGGVISGTGTSLIKNGSNLSKLTLTGNNTYTGITDLNNGIIQIGNGGTSGSFGSGDISLLFAGGATLLFNLSSDYALTNTVTGAGHIIQSGSGTLTFPTITDFSSLTLTANAGTIALDTDSTLSTVTLNSGGTLDLQDADFTGTDEISINGGTLRTSTGNSTYNGSVSLASSGFIRVDSSAELSLDNISGGLGIGFTKSGAGNLILTGANTYTGTTTINGGTLSVANDTALSTGNVIVNNTGTLSLSGSLAPISNDIALNNGSTLLESNPFGTNEISGDITLSGTVTITVNGASSDILTLSQTISGSGVTLNKEGAQTLVLSGENLYSGTTNVNAGTLAVGTSTALGTSATTVTGTLLLSGSALTIANAFTFNNGSTLSENNDNGTNELTGNIALNGTVAIDVSSVTNDTLTLSGILSGSSITLNKGGPGSLILSGASANTFTGSTNVNTGVVEARKTNALGNSAASVTVANNAALYINGTPSATDLTIPNAITINGTGISSTGAIADISTGRSNTLSGNITIGSDASSIGVTNSGNTLTLSGIIDDGASNFDLVKVGSGTLILSGTNTFGNATNGLAINGGQVTITNASALGAATAPTTVANNTTLAISGSGLVVANPITVNGSGFSGTGALVDSSGSNTFSGAITLGSHTSFGVTTLGDVLTLSGAIGDGGNGFNFTKLGDGTLTLSNTNTYTGTTTVSNGVLNIASNNALGTSGTHTASVTVSSGGTIRLTNAVLAPTLALSLSGVGEGSVGALLGSGTSTWNGNISLGAATTIATNAGADVLTLNSTINGAFDLTFSGAGSITLGGTIGNSSAPTLLTANTNLTISGGTITTAGTQTYNNAVVFGADNTFDAGNNTITFAAIDTDSTPRSLTIGSSGNTGAITLGGNIGAGVNGAIGAITLNSTNTTSINGTVNAASLTTNAGGTTQINGASITTTGNQVYGDNVTLGTSPTIKSGSGTINFNGTLISGAQSLSLQDASSTGAVSFNDNVTLLDIITFAGAYNVSLLGTTTAITNNVDFLNTGIVTLGNGGDTLTFAGGLTATSPSSVAINGTVRTNGNTLNIGAITLGGTSSIATNNTVAAGAALTIGAVTSAGNALTLNSGTSNTISGSSFAGGGDLTITNSNGTTFSGAVNAGTVTLTNTTGTMTFNGLTASTLTTTANGYNLVLNGTNTITNALSFLNTGTLTLGNGGTSTFVGGLDTTGGPSSVTINGTTRTNGNTMVLGAITLGGTSSLATNNTVAAGAGLTIGAITSAGNALTLNSGTGGAISGTSFAGGGDLTITNSGGTTFSGAINAGAVTLTNTTGTIAFNNNVTATSLATAANSFDLSLFGSTTSITSAATLLNTGTTSFGNGGDTLTFAGGLTASAGTSVVNGTLQSNGSSITLGAVTLGGTSSIATNNTVAAGAGLTLGAITSAGNTLSLNSGTGGAISGSTFAGGGDLTITNSGGATFSGTVNAGTVTLTDTTDAANITFNGLTANTLTTTANAYNVVLNGTNTITNALSFLSTGSVTLGNGGTSTFVGGLTTTGGPTSVTINGVTRSNGNTITLGAITLGGTSSIATNNTVAAGAGLTLGAITSAGNALTLNAGTGGTISGTSFAGGGDLTITNSGGATFSGTVNTGTATLTNTTGTITFNGLTASTLSTAANAYNLVLNGANTITNALSFLNTGSLTLGNGGSSTFTGGLDTTGGPSSVTINGTLNTTNTAMTLGAITLSGNSAFNSGSGTLTIGTSLAGGGNTLSVTNTDANSVISAVITNLTSLTKSGSGTLTISGNNSAYSGTTNINNGTLQIGIASNALGSGALVFNGGNIQSNLTATLANGYTLSSAAAITGSNALTLGGTGVLNNTLTVSNTGGTTLSGNLSGTGGITENASGSTLTLSGTNTYTGATNVTAGTLILSNNNAIGSGGSNSSGVSIATGAVLNLAGVTIAPTVALTLNGTGISSNGALVASGTSSYAGDITLNTDSSINSTGTLALSGVISGSSALSSIGTGSITLSNANSYTGATNITNGTVTITNAQALGNASAGTTVNSNGTLNINTTGVNEPITLNNGTLASTGVASLNGNISLASSTNNIVNSNLGSVFTLNGNINDGGNLTFQGAGTINFVGSIGNTTRIGSLTSNADVSITSSTIRTTNSQTYNNLITLVANTLLDSLADVIFASTIDGGFDLTVSSGGTATFGGAVGATALNSLNVTANTINLNGGSIATVGDQTYTGNVVLGASTVLSTSSIGTTNITFTNGIGGNQNLTLNSGVAGTNNYSIGGTLALNNISIAPSIGTSNNTFTLNTGAAQTWSVSGSNTGSLSGVTGVAGTFNFSNIHNITGGSGNDSFSLNGGTLTGSINGGSGTNSLTSDSVVSTWNIAGSNAGSVTGVGGTFSNIQNLIGGNNNNTFIFADGSSISGTVNGGSLSNVNTLDYSNYVSATTITLSSTFVGITTDATSAIVNSFSNINQVMGDYTNDSIDTSAKAFSVTFTGNREGFIDDPLYFFGFSVSGSPPEPTPTTTPSNVVNVMQQPTTNSSENSPVTPITPEWVLTSDFTSQNLETLMQQFGEQTSTILENVTINPTCFSAN